MEAKEWFAEWFDTPYYHTLYKDRNDEEASTFIANLISILHLKKKSRILDLACGKGRHSITLNNLGYNVLGVDLSENSISHAKHSENDTLEFAIHDMRKQIEDEKFEAIFNLFTSFGYFDTIFDNKNVVQSIHHMLVDDGYLIIDFMNTTRLISKLVKKETKIVDGITFEIERKHDGEHIFKDIRFTADGKEHHYTERVQALKESDFINLLTNHGFDIISTFGDFSLNPFNERLSDRLIIISKKI